MSVELGVFVFLGHHAARQVLGEARAGRAIVLICQVFSKERNRHYERNDIHQRSGRCHRR